MQPEKRKRRHIEREFGVPGAGEILDPSRWTQTALKKWPAEGTFDRVAVVGRRAPLVVEVGCRNGRVLLARWVSATGPRRLRADSRPLAAPPASPPLH